MFETLSIGQIILLVLSLLLWVASFVFQVRLFRMARVLENRLNEVDREPQLEEHAGHEQVIGSTPAKLAA